jgi:hypothetical protein
MEYAISWGEGPEDVLVETSGPAVLADLEAMTGALVADPRFRAGLAIVIDHTRAQWASLTPTDIRRRAAGLAALSARIGPQRIAFVVGGTGDYGIGRMLELLTEEDTQLRTRIFRSRDDARAWLADGDAEADG